MESEQDRAGSSRALPSERAVVTQSAKDMRVGNDQCPKCLVFHPITFDCALPAIEARQPDPKGCAQSTAGDHHAD